MVLCISGIVMQYYDSFTFNMCLKIHQVGFVCATALTKRLMSMVRNKCPSSRPLPAAILAVHQTIADVGSCSMKYLQTTQTQWLSKNLPRRFSTGSAIYIMYLLVPAAQETLGGIAHGLVGRTVCDSGVFVRRNWKGRWPICSLLGRKFLVKHSCIAHSSLHCRCLHLLCVFIVLLSVRKNGTQGDFGVSHKHLIVDTTYIGWYQNSEVYLYAILFSSLDTLLDLQYCEGGCLSMRA